MSNVDINEFKKIQEDYNNAVASEREMQTELKMLKKQGADILKEYGYTSFSDVHKMKDKLAEMEQEIQGLQEEMLEYIKFVNEKKANKDNIIMG